MLKANEVFIPGAFPTHTYVYRKAPLSHFTYEFRLQHALNTPGYLTSIIGPSKSGKTVLCEKVIGMDNIVAMSGIDFKISEDFWAAIAKKIGLSLEGEYTKVNALKGEVAGGLMERNSSSVTESYRAGKDKIIQYFVENKLVLVLDDFHYAPEAMQYEVAFQLKDAIRRRFSTVIISLPHRADDAIRKNPDLSGRLNLINIEPWNQEELSEIAVTGFRSLGMEIDIKYAERMALESLASPQLMQSICLNLAFVLDIDNNRDSAKIHDASQLEEAYRMTTINLSYSDVVRKLKTGPNPRGQQRKLYMLATGQETDIYELLLKAIAKDPPAISISLDNLKKRIDDLLDAEVERPDRPKIKATIQQIQSIMDSSESMYQVFEYKDDEIYILDPLFLFFLRWGVH